MDKIKKDELYSVAYLKDKGLLDAPSFFSLYNLVPTAISPSEIQNSLEVDASPVMQVIGKPLTNAGTAVLTAGYRNDYIDKGQSFANATVRTVTAGTEFFVLDASGCNCKRVYKLPITVSPIAGYTIVNLYEDTEYLASTETLTFINRSRISKNSPGASLKTATANGSKGTLLFGAVFGVEGTNQNAGGGSGASANSLILDPLKKYLFEVTYSETTVVGYNMEIVEV